MRSRRLWYNRYQRHWPHVCVATVSPRIFRVWVGVNSGRDSGRFSGCFRALSGFSGPFPGFPGPFRVLSGSTQKGPGKGPENPERARKTRKGPGEPGGGHITTKTRCYINKRAKCRVHTYRPRVYLAPPGPFRAYPGLSRPFRAFPGLSGPFRALSGPFRVQRNPGPFRAFPGPFRVFRASGCFPGLPESTPAFREARNMRGLIVDAALPCHHEMSLHSWRL